MNLDVATLKSEKLSFNEQRKLRANSPVQSALLTWGLIVFDPNARHLLRQRLPAFHPNGWAAWKSFLSRDPMGSLPIPSWKQEETVELACLSLKNPWDSPQNVQNNYSLNRWQFDELSINFQANFFVQVLAQFPSDHLPQSHLDIDALVMNAWVELGGILLAGIMKV